MFVHNRGGTDLEFQQPILHTIRQMRLSTRPHVMQPSSFIWEDVSAGMGGGPLVNNCVIWNCFIQMFKVVDNNGWSWVAGSEGLIRNKGVLSFRKSWKRVCRQKAAFAAEMPPGWPDELPWVSYLGLCEIAAKLTTPHLPGACRDRDPGGLWSQPAAGHQTGNWRDTVGNVATKHNTCTAFFWVYIYL